MNAPRVVFAGTPAFALPSLAALVEAGIRPLAVYTQPDRRKGRGRNLAGSPVKDYAMTAGLPVQQPLSLRDPGARETLAALRPELVVVVAYGLIFPQAALDIPRLGCLNVHASLLPRWRGAAPIQAAVASGDRQTGISLMRMEAGLDSGPVYAQAALDIGADETAGELQERLAQLGGDLLRQSLPGILAGSASADPQPQAGVTHAGKIATSDALLDWRRPAQELARQVRAYNPVPGARFEFDGETVKCWQAVPVNNASAQAGRVLAAGRDGIDVACGDGALRLLEVQRPGRGRVSGGEFAAQRPLAGRDFAVAAV